MYFVMKHFYILTLPLDIYILFIFNIHYGLLYLLLHIHYLKKNFVVHYTLHVYKFTLFIYIYITLCVFYLVCFIE